MSLFQCGPCGCLENTACTSGYHSRDEYLKRDAAAYESYRQVLGLKPDEPWPGLCSACVPIWFTDEGETYGIGPRPADYKKHKYLDGDGMWHGTFARKFLPRGLFHTDEQGNLRHIETLVYSSESGLERDTPWPDPPRYQHPDFRLPAHNPEDERRWKDLMSVLAPAYWSDADTRAKLDEKGGLLFVVDKMVENKAEITTKMELPPAMQMMAEEAFKKPMRHRQKVPSMAMALAALAGMASGPGYGRGREPEEPRPLTCEEREAAAARGEAKKTAAEKKRERKAAKRFENQVKADMGKSKFPAVDALIFEGKNGNICVRPPPGVDVDARIAELAAEARDYVPDNAPGVLECRIIEPSTAESAPETCP